MKKSLPDVHLEADERGIPLDRVGVRDLALPAKVLRADGSLLDTVGRFDLGVSLAARRRGAHLSRLVAAAQRRRGPWSTQALVELCQELKRQNEAEEAAAELRFTFFLEKTAPASGAKGLLEVPCALGARVGAGGEERWLEAQVAVTTLCPCSKAISKAGAHNQRSVVRLRAWVDGALPLEELIGAAEESASCELYAVLKRPDEKFVTERAFARPRFVEDVVREAAGRLRGDARIARWELEVRSQESIHAHDAYAALAAANVRRPAGPGPRRRR